jgi:hypothetical protein
MITGVCLRARRAQHAKAVEAGQHHVEHDHRVVAFQRQVQALDAVARQVHGVALFRQAAVQVVRGFSSSSMIRTRMTRLSVWSPTRALVWACGTTAQGTSI